LPSIHETLGPSESRDLVFDYDTTLNSLKTMTYGSHVWHDDQVAQ
jgi:hypothetical protein